MRVDVHVLNCEDNPLVDKRVTISFINITSADWDAYTDSDGHAEFADDGLFAVAEGEATIQVNDETFGPYFMQDGDAFTVNLSTVY